MRNLSLSLQVQSLDLQSATTSHRPSWQRLATGKKIDKLAEACQLGAGVVCKVCRNTAKPR